MPNLPGKKCCGCNSCGQICPENAISMVNDAFGFNYPEVNNSKCIECKLCEKSCPVINFIENENFQPLRFAVKNKNEEVRKNSSSGGVFYLLAKSIINRNGVVFGVKFDEDFNVIHSHFETLEEIKYFMGSKYVQSINQEEFKLCKKYLQEGRFVLFTGTPCQIAALKSFLGKIYDNLYLMDIICHGVPSNKIWKIFCTEIENRKKSKIKSVTFRDKSYGWNLFALKFDLKNGACYKKHQASSEWMLTFNKNIMMRKSCYYCDFKRTGIQSDITVGDFWGMNEYLESKNDNKGYSIVYINTEKGKRIFDENKLDFISDEISSYDENRFNTQYLKPVNEVLEREEFLNNCITNGFADSYKKYVKEGFISHIYKMFRIYGSLLKRKIRRIVQ